MPRAFEKETVEKNMGAYCGFEALTCEEFAEGSHFLRRVY